MKPSACNNSSATYWGAMQMPLILIRRTVFVSGGGPSANDPCTPTRLAAPAAERPPRKRRRLWMICMFTSPSRQTGSGFQLALQLVEEAPIRAVGNDLLRARLDMPVSCMRSAKDNIEASAW